MLTPNRFIFVCLLFFIGAGTAHPARVVDHSLEVRIDPQREALSVLDNLTLPPGTERLEFFLHAGMSPQVVEGPARLASLGRSGHLERFALIPATGITTVGLRYGGRIRHGFQEVSEGVGRSHRRTSGTIGPEGTVLDGASGWYPWAPDSLQRFSLTIDLPEHWLAVSQGSGPDIERRAGRVLITWREAQPQDDIHLVAGPLHLHREPGPVAEAQVYLRDADPTLARRYLRATGRYLDLYSRLIGDYPYAKFALVENFWPTGYGMPSFTLLGSRVIRLPFIVDTSFPHEILHNWWGNSVYVDYATGNWSEGLTTYLADHLLQEQLGRGAAYRRDALRRFADYVHTGKDFPLRAFRSRHSGASQSVGYGKGFMLFHMLRKELGDPTFLSGLRRFYRDNRFRTAGYADLRRAFESASGRDLGAFFTQWLERTGSPTLALADVSTEPAPTGYRVSGRLLQTQAEPAFLLNVPVLVHVGEGRTEESLLRMSDKELRFRLEVDALPLRLDADPRFEVFRTLYPEESPPTLGAMFGADHGLILLPDRAPASLAEAYEGLARSWVQGYDGWEVRWDREFQELPTDRVVWLLGWENRHRPEVARRLPAGSLESDALELEGSRLSRRDHSLVLVAPGRTPGAPPVAWLGAHDARAVPGLARKLPHYGKYARLAFQGLAPENVHKSQWATYSSPLRIPLAEGAKALEIPALPALSAGLE
jgi:hypothetical protein